MAVRVRSLLDPNSHPCSFKGHIITHGQTHHDNKVTGTGFSIKPMRQLLPQRCCDGCESALAAEAHATSLQQLKRWCSVHKLRASKALLLQSLQRQSDKLSP